MDIVGKKVEIAGEKIIKLDDLEYRTVLYKAKELDINVVDVERSFNVLKNKIKKINGDLTLTPSNKLLKVNQLLKTDGAKFADNFSQVGLSIENKLEEYKKDTYQQQLRSTALTADEKLLLPMVKEQFEKTKEVSDNDSFNRQLLFLQDNGLISNVERVLSTRTDPAVAKTISDAKIALTMFINTNGHISDTLLKEINNPKIVEIQNSLYDA